MIQHMKGRLFDGTFVAHDQKCAASWPELLHAVHDVVLDLSWPCRMTNVRIIRIINDSSDGFKNCIFKNIFLRHFSEWLISKKSYPMIFLGNPQCPALPVFPSITDNILGVVPCTVNDG